MNPSERAKLAEVEELVRLALASAAGTAASLAIIFDGGGTNTPNLRTTRVKRSLMDSTKTGINNFGSDTTGAAPGATADFCTILGGDQCSAGGAYACAGGHLAEALGDHSFAYGDQALVKTGCTGGVAIGFQSLVEQVAGFALGAMCHI